MIDSSSLLPQRLDLSHGASVGDIDSDGDIDIVVNNLIAKTVEPYKSPKIMAWGISQKSRN